MASSLLKYVPPLPATIADLQSSFDRSVRAQARRLMFSLWEDDNFRGYINTTEAANSRQGSMAADYFLASQTLQRLARKEGITEISNMNLHRVQLLIKDVLKEAGIAPAQRRAAARLAAANLND